MMPSHSATARAHANADPAVAAGDRIEDILRHLPHPPEDAEPGA